MRRSDFPRPFGSCREFFRGGSEALWRTMFRPCYTAPSWADGVLARVSATEVVCVFANGVLPLWRSRQPHVTVMVTVWTHMFVIIDALWRLGGRSLRRGHPQHALCDSHGGCCCGCGREEGVAAARLWTESRYRSDGPDVPRRYGVRRLAPVGGEPPNGCQAVHSDPPEL